MGYVEDVAVIVIVNRRGEILLTQRFDPSIPSIHMKWQLPGGKKERNETLEEACIREAKEETGLSVRLVTSNPHKILQKLQKRTLLLCGFRAEPISGTISVEKDRETHDAKWYLREEISKLETLEQTVEMIDACLTHGRRTN